MIRERKEKKKAEEGFSLIESLISLSLFLIILLSSLEFFASIRSHFLKLKDEQEVNEAAYSALDKMRKDILQGGSGLTVPVRLGVLEGISDNNGSFIIYAQEKDLSLLTDLTPGQTRILVGSTKKIKKGRELCIFDFDKGEVKSISSVYKDSLVLSSPLDSFYLKDKASLVLLKKISFFLDEDKHLLRRKVNASPAQPLLEDVTFFDHDYQKTSNLARLRLALKANKNKEREYEISVFPKNMALASSR